MRTYDVIVLGLGGMGSATAYHLARRGRHVLGLEQFSLVHDRGSSHGHTRVIRQAYYESPQYVPLAIRAYEHWYALEQTTGEHLFTLCGCLNLGTESGGPAMGALRSAAEHGLLIENLPATEIRRRFPAIRCDDNVHGVYEPNAGFLYVERCVQAHLEAAQAIGAELHAEERVQEWRVTHGGVEVRTDRDVYHAARLVITAGAWATRLLGQLGIPLTVMRQVLCWFLPSRPERFRRDVFPVYMYGTPDGDFYYGLPMVDSRGIKVARHYGAAELPGPESVDWSVHDADETPVRAFLDRYLPDGVGPRTTAEVCMYTLTPDRHFILDLHPGHPQVAIATGFSGHGFKFASVVGEIMADLSDSGRTALEIGAWSVRREATSSVEREQKRQ